MRRNTLLLLALICVAVSGCGDTAGPSRRSGPSISQAEVLRILRQKLNVWTDSELPNVYMFSGGSHQIKGTCVINFNVNLLPGETHQGADLLSPDGHLRIHVTNPYTIETHSAQPLSICLQTLRETLKW